MSARPVVVGIDGTPLSRAALLWAAGTAVAARRSLLIAHGSDFSGAAGPDRDDAEAGGSLLRAAEAIVHAAEPTCVVSSVLLYEKPEPLLDRLSLTAEMIVVGSAAEGRLSAALYGSVSSHLAAHGRCTVVTVPTGWIDTEASRQPRVVAAVTPSAGGRAALAFAAAYAHDTQGRVQAIYCWDRASAADESDPLAERDLCTARLDALIKQALTGENFDVVISPRVTPGPVEDVIRHAAHDASIVVVGSRFPAEAHGSRLGPIASRLMRRMPCPVALVSANTLD